MSQPMKHPVRRKNTKREQLLAMFSENPDITFPQSKEKGYIGSHATFYAVRREFRTGKKPVSYEERPLSFRHNKIERFDAVDVAIDIGPRPLRLRISDGKNADGQQMLGTLIVTPEGLAYAAPRSKGREAPESVVAWNVIRALSEAK